MTSANVKEDNIYLILKDLYPEKAHGYDDISIRIIPLCETAIVEPLQILFLFFLENGSSNKQIALGTSNREQANP